MDKHIYQFLKKQELKVFTDLRKKKQYFQNAFAWNVNHQVLTKKKKNV